MSKDEIVEMILEQCFQEIDETKECAESYGRFHSKLQNEQFAKDIVKKWVAAVRESADKLENMGSI